MRGTLCSFWEKSDPIYPSYKLLEISLCVFFGKICWRLTTNAHTVHPQ